MGDICGVKDEKVTCGACPSLPIEAEGLQEGDPRSPRREGRQARQAGRFAYGGLDATWTWRRVWLRALPGLAQDHDHHKRFPLTTTIITMTIAMAITMAIILMMVSSDVSRNRVGVLEAFYSGSMSVRTH